MPRPMIYKVCVGSEDETPVLTSNSLAIQDQSGNHLGDADNFLEAMRIATEFAVAQGLEKVEVLLTPV